MRLIYLILICFAAPVAASIAWFRGVRNPANRERLADRFGRPRLRPAGATIWVHAASMGEVQASATLVRLILKDYPRHDVIMTTMTTTGAARVRALFPDRVSHCYLPYDLPFAVRGFLDRARPAFAIVLETELWPNLFIECRRRGIRLAIANARISPRTVARYRRFRALFRDTLRDSVVMAQSAADAERFAMLGAIDVQVAGNLKFDIEIPDSVRQAGAALRISIGSRFTWVAGSTHAGEEIAAIAAHRALLAKYPAALLIVVPRHPQRFDEVRTLLTESGLPFVSRSSGASPTSEARVILVDVMGELLRWYVAADLAFVGGSLVPVGGHNLLEPAALGVATLCGPHLNNTRDVADRLLEAGGVLQVATDNALRESVLALAGDPEKRAQIGRQGQAVVTANRGAAAQMVKVIKDTVAGTDRQSL